jgi:ERCC4-related helicase
VSLDDPKLSKIYEVVSHLVNSEQRKVLVFSKYLDTIGAIHQFFLKEVMPGGDCALFRIGRIGL